MTEDRIYPTIKESTLILFITFLIYLTLSLVIGGPLGVVGIAILELLLIAPTLIFLRIKKIPFKHALRLHPVPMSVMITSLFIGLGCAVVIDEINRLMQNLLPMNEELLRQMQDFLIWDSPGEAVILFLGAVVFAALSEELLFRGFYQTSLESRIEITKSVMMTALIFTVLHFQPWAFIEFTLIGIFLGVVAWRANSVWPAMIFHAVINTLSLLMTNIDPSVYAWYEWHGHVAPWWIAGGILLIYFGFQTLYRLTEPA